MDVSSTGYSSCSWPPCRDPGREEEEAFGSQVCAPDGGSLHTTGLRFTGWGGGGGWSGWGGKMFALDSVMHSMGRICASAMGPLVTEWVGRG